MLAEKKGWKSENKSTKRKMLKGLQTNEKKQMQVLESENEMKNRGNSRPDWSTGGKVVNYCSSVTHSDGFCSITSLTF